MGMGWGSPSPPPGGGQGSVLRLPPCPREERAVSRRVSGVGGGLGALCRKAASPAGAG